MTAIGRFLPRLLATLSGHRALVLLARLDLTTVEATFLEDS